MSDDPLFSKFGREFSKGTVLFREGDTGKEMYVIQAGAIAISKRVRDAEKVLATLGPGEFFGEMAIISNKPRTATATVAAETARCLVIDPKTFEAMVRTNAEIAVRMIKKLADRLQEADTQIENLLLRDANSRVAHYLAHAAESRGKKVVGGMLVELSPASLAGTLGIDVRQLDGVFEKLARAKLASVEADGVLVPDAGKLREFLEFLEMKEKFGDI